MAGRDDSLREGNFGSRKGVVGVIEGNRTRFDKKKDLR